MKNHLKTVRKNRNINNNKGFSLVEIIIVIAIMVVLVGVLAPMYIIHVERSRESMDIQDMDLVYRVAYATYAEEGYRGGVMYYYGREELTESTPAAGYGKGSIADGGRSYPNPCCEDGAYDPSLSYKDKYIMVIFPEVDDPDQTIHVHWVH